MTDIDIRKYIIENFKDDNINEIFDYIDNHSINKNAYILGLEKGGIDERWFASTTWAENGPDTPFDEGLSYVVSKDGSEQMLLRDMVDELQDLIIGDLWNKYHKWPMFSKFFDNAGPLPHHIHHRDEHAKRVGADGKPEMYFFPSQMNNHGGEFPFTFFGLNPDCKKEDIKKCLENFHKVNPLQGFRP